MAGRLWDRVLWLVLAALLLGAGEGLFARPPAPAPDAAAPGSLSGRLTDLRSSPLGGVTLTLRNQATGAAIRTTTSRNGSYRFAGLAPGGYILEAQSESLGTGELEGIEVAPGHESRVQAAMALGWPVPGPPPVRAANPAPGPARYVPARTTRGVAATGLPEIGMSERAGPGQVAGAVSIAAQATEVPAALPLEAMLRLPLPQGMPANLVQAVAPLPGLALSAAVAEAAARGVAAALRFGAPALRQAEGGQVQAEVAAAAVTTTVSGEQLQALPASGRRWQELFLDTPAASSAQGSEQVALRGAGQDAADSTVDGASTRLAFGGSNGQTAVPATDAQGEVNRGANADGAAGTERGFMVGEAAIREVRVVAGNVEAEGAHAAGGRIGVETESGGDTLHGQSFLYDRQKMWGARNPFTSLVKETAPATTLGVPVFTAEPYTPPDHELVWGIGAGSRIRRKKLFWFGALDGRERNDPGVAMVRNPAHFFAQPSNAQMQLLSAQLDLPSTNPVGEGLAAYSPMLEKLAGLLGPAPRRDSKWTGFARFDWQAAERHRLAVEGSGAVANAPGGGTGMVSENYGTASFGSRHSSQEWLLARWEAFLTPNLLAVTEGSAGREIVEAPAQKPSPFEREFLAGNAYGQLPQITVDSRYGFTIGNPARFGEGSYPDERLYQAQERLEWVHGRLLAKAGWELDHNRDATTLLRNRTGSYFYSKVENFAADALAFEKFGANPSNPLRQHNCDAHGRPWTAGGVLMGLGSLPCYSHFSQVIGPEFWQLTTNDWAGYVSAQWQLNTWAVFSAGLRWDREQVPPPIKLVDNPELPLTEHAPEPGNEWGPRVSLAIGNRKQWPVLRLGYGMYYGRTPNATLQSAFSQTGSAKGDLYFFIRPSDGYSSATGTGSAPLFPNVLNGRPGSVVVPGAVEYAPGFRNPEVHQALASVEEELPGRVRIAATGVISLGRRLPISIDTNTDPAVNPRTITYAIKDPTGKGPIRSGQLTVPYYALWPASECAGLKLTLGGQCGRLNPDYQQIAEITSRANSTYEAAMLRFTRNGSHGLSLHASYTYAHAMDWNPDGSTRMAGSDVLDPANFSAEYGTSNLDVRHAAAAMVIFRSPWKLRGWAGRVADGWMVSGIGNFRGGLPYSMHVTGSMPEEFTSTGAMIVGLGPSMNGSGGDTRLYGMARNMFRYPSTWKADARLGRSFGLGERRELELQAESFNLFNHRNVTRIGTTGYAIENGSAAGSAPQLCYLTVNAYGTDSCQSTAPAGGGSLIPAFGQPLGINTTNYYRERQIQLGARFRF